MTRGIAEEVWLPESGGAMSGTFRSHPDLNGWEG
jgi:hypothetical protein